MRHVIAGRGARGFTLVEILVALTILALVITTSLAIFFDRQKRLKHAADSIAAWQVLTNEAEIWRHAPWPVMEPGSEEDFISDTDLIDSLPNVSAVVAFEEYTAGIREVTLTVRWGESGLQRQATLSLYRANLAGGTLF